jgi:hypothetical protein
MRKFYLPLLVAFAALILPACRKQDSGIIIQPEAVNYSSKVASEWMHTIEKVVQSEGANPPVASRVYAYAAIGLYESVLPGMQGYQSLQGQIPGLANIPDSRSFDKLDYITSANETLYQIATRIFVTLKPENLKAIEDLHSKYYKNAFTRVLSETVNTSTDFGKMVATAVLDRANNDNFSNTRSLSYLVPSSTANAANWSPTGAVLVPLEPYWGQIKCFAMAASGACTIKSSIPFSTATGSDFYNQAKEVYTASLSLTSDQKAIANWWSDGSSQTATPPGHWVAIVDEIADQKNLDLGKAAEVYAMVNIAMADAFISCWDEKYKMNLLRPVTYIRNYITGNSSWTPYLSTPPFPEYPSGHSVASGAASQILTNLLGSFSFTDSANVYLGYAPRSYNSFIEAANEAAISRLYGGIHFREAIDNGLKQGKEVSKAIIDKIKLKK